MNAAERSGARIETEGAEMIEVHDVRPILENKKSWLTLVHTTPSGLRLLARIEGDEIMEWIVQDPSGRPVPTVTYQQKQKKDPPKKECRICVTIAGETSCWLVPCDKIVILPKIAGGDESDGVVEVHDISPILKNVPLSEGLNRVFTTPSGLQFSAKVEGGEIEWQAYDPDGTQIPTTVYQKKPKKPKGEPIKCQVCTTEGGKTTCVEVPCEKIRILT